jgi:hypothetical protein
MEGLSDGHRTSVWEDQKVPGLDGRDSLHSNMNAIATIELDTLK